MQTNLFYHQAISAGCTKKLASKVQMITELAATVHMPDSRIISLVDRLIKAGPKKKSFKKS